MGAIGNKRSHPQPLQCIPTRKASSLHSSYCGLALLLLLGLTTAALLCQLSRVVINWKQPDPKNVLHRRLHTPQSSVKLRLEKLERMELSYINSTTWNPTEAHRMVQVCLSWLIVTAATVAVTAVAVAVSGCCSGVFHTDKMFQAVSDRSSCCCMLQARALHSCGLGKPV